MRHASERLSTRDGWCYAFVEAVGQVAMRWLMPARGGIGEACDQESLWDRRMVLCVQASIQVCDAFKPTSQVGQRRLRSYDEGVTLFIGKLN